VRTGLKVVSTKVSIAVTVEIETSANEL